MDRPGIHKRGMDEITMRELVDRYVEASGIERMKNDRPSESTVTNVLSQIKSLGTMLDGTFSKAKRVMGGGGTKEGGVSMRKTRLADCPFMDWPLSRFSRAELNRFIVGANKVGLAKESCYGLLYALRCLTSRWAVQYYADIGWDVSPFPIPPIRKPLKRYVRPPKRILDAVTAWYGTLWDRYEDRRIWVAATLMLEFAMRNSDVRLLKWSDFIPDQSGEGMVLCYMPHKTLHSSGRRVCWPVHPDIWSRLKSLRDGDPRFSGEQVVTNPYTVFERISADMKPIFRELNTVKTCYNLRKICVDHIYQKFGAEMASSISGDDIRTVMKYYADPSAVKVKGYRITDLL